MVEDKQDYKVKTFSKYGVWYPLVVFFVAIIVTAVVVAVIAVYNRQWVESIDNQLIVNTLLFALLGVGALIGVTANKKSFKEVFAIKHIPRKTLWLTLGGFLLAQPLLVAISAALNAIFQLGITGNSNTIIQNELSFTKMLAIVVVAPLFEELFFRGVLFDGFLNTFRKLIKVKDSIRVMITALFTAGFFGLIHFTEVSLSGIIAVVTTGVLGFIFAMIRIKTNSLALPILGHFVFNTTGFMLIIISVLLS